jgi:hypothetical protein
MFRKLLSYVLAGVLAMGLVGISSATAAVAPKITKAASLPIVINSGAKARVNPAVANLKATRTYIWYLNGERIDTAPLRSQLALGWLHPSSNRRWLRSSSMG